MRGIATLASGLLRGPTATCAAAPPLMEERAIFWMAVPDIWNSDQSPLAPGAPSTGE